MNLLVIRRSILLCPKDDVVQLAIYEQQIKDIMKVAITRNTN